MEHKIFAFGDIHGEFYKLKHLIKKVATYLSNNDVLIFLGDYIDRGKYSFEVIEYLIELKSSYTCIFLTGNHEEMFMDYLSGLSERMFINNGGQDTLDSYLMNGIDLKEKRIPKGHLDFFRSTKSYYETKDYIFVHAGIDKNTSIEKTPDEILLWDNSVYYSEYNGKTLVLGHTPNRIIKNEANKICIDTGSCFSDSGLGNLTCVMLPDREFFSQGALAVQ